MRIGLLGVGQRGTMFCDELAGEDFGDHEVRVSYLSTDQHMSNYTPNVPDDAGVYVEHLDRPGNVSLTRDDAREWVEAKRRNDQFYSILDQLYVQRRSATGEAQVDFGDVDCLLPVFHFGEAMAGALADVIPAWFRERVDAPVVGVGLLPTQDETFLVNTDRALERTVDEHDHCVLVDLLSAGNRLLNEGVVESDEDGTIDVNEMMRAIAGEFAAGFAPLVAGMDEDAADAYSHGDVSFLATGTASIDYEKPGLLSRFGSSSDGPTRDAAVRAADAAIADAVADAPTGSFRPGTTYRVVVTLAGPEPYLDHLSADVKATFRERLASECGVDYPADRTRLAFREAPAGELVASVYYQDVRNVERIKEIGRRSEEIRAAATAGETSSESELKDL